MSETPIRIVLSKPDVEALLGLVEEEIERNAGTGTGALWKALHTAMVQGLGLRPTG